jgi:O-acetylhomoserine (thiol)-lyase
MNVYVFSQEQQEMEFNTRLLHGRAVQKYAFNATVPQISQSTAFSFSSAEEQEAVFNHRALGYAYTRVANPTVAAFEQRMAELDTGQASIACSSGMAAVTASVLNIMTAGDELIAGSGLYGGTIDLFRDLKIFGIKVVYLTEMTPEKVEEAITDRTRAVYGEVIGNPGLGVMDIKAIADKAHEHGLPLIVDATTATPYLVQPIKLGADIVVHSTSKYVNGGGNSVSGVITYSGKFKWDFDRFTALKEFRKYGPLAYMIRLRTDICENLGGCLSPFNAFMNMVGMETLGLRMERICSNAYALAQALSKMPGVESVNYPLLDTSPFKGLAERELKCRGGGILTFRVGSKERAFKFINSLKYVITASNIGDVRTLAIHPESTLYINSNEEEKESAGVYKDLIRVTVGIEDIGDLISDFTEAARCTE